MIREKSTIRRYHPSAQITAKINREIRDLANRPMQVSFYTMFHVTHIIDKPVFIASSVEHLAMICPNSRHLITKKLRENIISRKKQFALSIINLIIAFFFEEFRERFISGFQSKPREAFVLCMHACTVIFNIVE
jgi:hypothetical protein